MYLYIDRKFITRLLSHDSAKIKTVREFVKELDESREYTARTNFGTSIKVSMAMFNHYCVWLPFILMMMFTRCMVAYIAGTYVLDGGIKPSRAVGAVGMSLDIAWGVKELLDVIPR